MKDQAEQEKAFAIVGKFVSIANGIELMVNGCLEIIIGKYDFELSSFGGVKSILENIQKQSIRDRILTTCLMLKMTSDNNQKIEAIISELSLIATDYNKNVRPVRDFLAHNPLTYNKHTKEHIVVSSRYKTEKIDYLSLEDVQTSQTKAGEIGDKLSKIAGEIGRFYKSDGQPRTLSFPSKNKK